ncbi:MAG: sensor histidine kinase [Bacteroidota bacterium]
MRSPSLVALVLCIGAGFVARGPEAQIRPPADTTGMIQPFDDIVLTNVSTGQVDSMWYAIYPDSTVGVYLTGQDTLFADYASYAALGLIVDSRIDDEELDQRIIWYDIIDGKVQFYFAQPIPVPLAIVLIIVLPLLIVATLVYLARRLRQERIQRRLLERAGRQLAESREGERVRIARDLHDGPLQDLHALNMRLGLAADTLDARAKPARMLQGTREDMHTVIGELRGITEALRPPALGPFGLAAALRSHAERFRRNHLGTEVVLDLDDDHQALPEPLRLVLFRVAQESMTNAVKHGGASRITVTFQLREGHASLTVADDGPGFESPPDVQDLAAAGHFGFLGMQERVDSVDGHLAMGNRPDGGAFVQVEVEGEFDRRIGPTREEALSVA